MKPVPTPIIFEGATIVTCDAGDRVLSGNVWIEAGRIVRVGRFRAPGGARVIDARDRIVLPGFVMAHVHLCQALMRGLADDLPLLAWLRERIWPLEAAHDERSLRASAELGLVELLGAGTTTILDLGSVHDYDVVFDACVRAGIRVCGGKSLMDTGRGVPKRLRESTRDSIRSAEQLEALWSAHPSGRAHHVWIPRFILSCSEALVRQAIERGRAPGRRFHTHASEHPGERAAVRQIHGADDVDVLRRWGMAGPWASIAHGVQLTPRQMRRLGADGTRVVHCPSANLKLGSGVAKVAALRAAGVVVGLGPDGAPCNNNLDPWLEMRHAALLSSWVAGPGALPARDVLRLATIDGARTLGLDEEVGSVEAGKAADLVVVRRSGAHAAPALDPIATLVYGAQSRDVEHVLVGGRFVVRSGELLTLDSESVVASARREAPRLLRRAGV